MEKGAHLLTFTTLQAAGIPFVVAGAYALQAYTGLYRQTKDLDVFLRRRDVPRALEALEAVNFRTEIVDPVWIAKAHASNAFFTDLIFCSGNGVAEVDDLWFARAQTHVIHGFPVRIAPPEEMIWSKSFVCERERYDGADVNHIILVCAEQMDWDHLLWRFGDHWAVLLSHLVLFRFAYPGHRQLVPRRVWDELLRRAREEKTEPDKEKLCRGTLLSKAQYRIDLDYWGFEDARHLEVKNFREHHREGPDRGGG
nr:MAG: hypothetical protein DIU72_04480 [Pseudomonadota bacterium]